MKRDACVVAEAITEVEGHQVDYRRRAADDEIVQLCPKVVRSPPKRTQHLACPAVAQLVDSIRKAVSVQAVVLDEPLQLGCGAPRELVEDESVPEAPQIFKSMKIRRRPESVTYVSGINCHPCARNGPSEGWRRVWDSNPGASFPASGPQVRCT